jgi:Gpi18-like mannosyltransferase
VTDQLSLPAAPPETARSIAEPGFAAGLRGSWRIWLGSRVVVAVLSIASAWALGAYAGRDVPGFARLWDRWDVGLFTKVARDGYLSPKYVERTEVDFPGLPLLLRAVHVIIPNWVVAGLVISLVAGAASSAALWSLAQRDLPADRLAGTRAVVAMVLFPYAVFLFAGYSEGLFLAGASCAWLAARQGRWWLAGLLACLATGSRSSGIAVVAALLVSFATSSSARRKPWSVLWLALPVGPIVGYLGYLRVRTGHWDAYTRAEGYWHRSADWPWNGFVSTWHSALNGSQNSAYQFFWWAEIIAVFVGVLLTIALCLERRWGEATFVAICLLLPISSTYWDAGVRALLVAFPLYLWLSRRRRIGYAYALLAAPLMAVFVVAFTQGSWVD